MSQTIDIDLLRTLVAVADSGSFSRAAGYVHRTQSAISMQMKRLEDIVGRPLFERDGRQMILTSDGKALTGYGRRMLALQEEALRRFRGDELTGTVRVGIPDDYAASLLPVLFARFAETHPNVHLQVRCEQSGPLRNALSAGEVDLAVLSFGSQTEEGTVLRREPAVWATSEQHMVHRQDPLPLAVFQPDCIFQVWAITALDALGRRYREAYTTSSVSAIQAAVVSGFAVTVVARSSLVPGMRELGADEGFPPLPNVSIVLCRSPRARNPATARLADEIIESFRKETS